MRGYFCTYIGLCSNPAAPFVIPLIQSFIHSFIHSSTHSLTHSLIHSEYNKISGGGSGSSGGSGGEQAGGGDAVFVRALFEHAAENEGELSFKKNDILYVDDTVYQGQVGGLWRAWLVDNQGNKLRCGTVWSKAKSVHVVLHPIAVALIGKNARNIQRRLLS